MLKLNIKLVVAGVIFCGIFSSCKSNVGKKDALQREETRRNILSETKKYLPDSKYKKVKIPGRREQVLKAVSGSKRIWKSIAPGYMNVPSNVVLRGDTITMLIDIGGLMQSKDAGKTWNYISYQLEGGITGRSFFDFDISPVNEKNIVIGGNRIYTTTNGGKNWKEINRGLPPLRYFTRGNGYGQVKFNADGSRLFSCIGTKVFMPISGIDKLLKKQYKQKLIFVSSDSGNSFKQIELDSPFAIVKKIYSHPSNPDIVWFSFADGDFYMSKNAKSEKMDFHKIAVPKGYFVRDISVSPSNSKLMLLSMANIANQKKEDAKLFVCDNCCDGKMETRELLPKDKNGNAIKSRDFMTVGFNPSKKNQVVIGSAYDDSILISDDNMKSFRVYHLPEKFYMEGREGHFYGNIERIFLGKSPFAVVISRIGTWITKNDFKTLEDLTMTYSNGLLGNKGIGSPANINALTIAKNNIYFSAQDHRAWRSSGSGYSKWTPITGKHKNDTVPQQNVPWGKLSWFWGIRTMFPSYDEKCIYLEAYAWKHNYKGHGFWQDKKFFVSRDQGETWSDITALLGKGDIYPGNSQFEKVLFDSNDSSKQWFLFSDAIYYSNNGGKSFAQCNSKLFREIKRKNNIFFTDIACDAKHNILYLSASVKDNELEKRLNHSKTPAALCRSFDMGKTWEVYNVGQNSIKSIGVTDSGALCIGTMKSADQPARLIVIPYGKEYSEDMVKMTMGDTPDEISANQLSFWPIVTDGDDILAYANINWVNTDRFFAQGPLLSTDDGKTFNWINYDLPCNNIWSAHMKDGKIAIGTIFGLMYWKYK